MGETPLPSAPYVADDLLPHLFTGEQHQIGSEDFWMKSLKFLGDSHPDPMLGPPLCSPGY